MSMILAPLLLNLAPPATSPPAAAAPAQDALPAQSGTDAARLADLEARLAALAAELAERPPSPATPSWVERFTLGGYGEIHLNQTEGSGGDQIDLHRFVIYLGYRFSDGLELHSETEFEHGLVGEDGDGELAMEQLYVEARLSDAWSLRAGRWLTPLGIVNQVHEPTAFHGVERPLFDTVVIPTTWSSDGAGVVGRFSDALSCELYVGTSLDGSGFDALEGIREGRQEGVAGISQPALSGRVDWRVLRAPDRSARLGASFFTGGLDNGPEGEDPGVDASLDVVCLDVQVTIGPVDLRGAWAVENVHGADSLPAGTASQIGGWNAEAAWRFWPAAWKTGGLSDSDAALFVRYDDVDTQQSMPDGESADPAGARTEWTFGVSFFPVHNLVVKLDYQIRDDEAEGLPERFNAGIGWSF
jgi:hypothetical protein